MANREEMIAALDGLYAARKQGDKLALATYFALGATFRIAGRSEQMGFEAGPVDAVAAIGHLIDMFQFHAMDRVSMLVDGNVAMIHWRIEVSAVGGTPAVTEVCDIWTLDEAGKAVSLVEFVDTALIAQMAAGG